MFKNELGNRYGRLLVVALHVRPKDSRNRAYWICKCDCGNEKSVLGSHLRSKAIVSCGCYGLEGRNKRINLTGKVGRPIINEAGKRYGHLLVIERQVGQSQKSRWVCRCDCGRETVAFGCDLRRGEHRSCGNTIDRRAVAMRTAARAALEARG